MKRIISILLTFIFVGSFFACQDVDFGNINDNKNGYTTPATSGLLSGAIMSYATITGRSGVTIPTLYVQYQSQVTYTDEMQYAEVPYSWEVYYTQSLIGLNKIIEINSDASKRTPDLIAQGDPVNQIGVAKIMKAIIMKRVTDTWGEVPFSGAFKGLDGISPAYDKQEDIYKALITDIKAARDMIDASKTAVKGDIIYNGNMNRWKKLANSLLLQMSLQLSKRYPAAGGYAATEFNSALSNSAGVIQTVADEAWFSFQDLVGFRNPWFANRTADYFMSAEFIDAMKGNNSVYNPTSNRTYDDRIKSYVHQSHQTRNGVPYGYRTGSGAGRAQMSPRYWWNATSPLPLMTASYTYLNRAEAAARGWTTEIALTMLSNGIDKSFETLVDKSAKTVPTAFPLTITSTSYRDARIAQIGVSATLLQVIAEEKWKSLFGQAFDAWAEWRRTEIPTLKPATDYSNSGAIPRRFLYPGEEASLNAANYNSAVSRLNPGKDSNTSKSWWDQ